MKDQAKMSIDRAKEKWGKAWDLLSDEQKEGAIALQALRLLHAQAHEKYKPVVSFIDEVWSQWNPED